MTIRKWLVIFWLFFMGASLLCHVLFKLEGDRIINECDDINDFDTMFGHVMSAGVMKGMSDAFIFVSAILFGFIIFGVA